MKPSPLLGFDIGGTTLKSVAFSPEGKILQQRAMPTNDDGTDSWLVRARDFVGVSLRECPPHTRFGIAAPGLAAPDGRSIKSMPGRLRGLEGMDWQTFLGSAYPVPVLNDAQAALLGETWLGAAKGAKDVMLLTLGTGVGGAAMVDGHLLRGHLGRAGHLGHISLNPRGALDIVNTPGSLEDAIGEHTLLRRSSGAYSATSKLLVDVSSAVPQASEIWLESVNALGAALASLINVLDPEIVMLGGGIADAGEMLFVPLQAALDRFEWRPGGAKVRLAKATLGPIAGAAGAAFSAQETE